LFWLGALGEFISDLRMPKVEEEGTRDEGRNTHM
jgi:hypothetical protein